MSRAEVLVDASFLVALADSGSHSHPAARDTFAELLAAHRAGEVHVVTHAAAIGAASERLFAAGVLGTGGAVFADLIAVVEVEPVHRDQLRLARRTMSRRADLDLVQALTLVMLSRRHIDRIASFDPLYEQLSVTRLPVG